MGQNEYPYLVSSYRFMPSFFKSKNEMLLFFFKLSLLLALIYIMIRVWLNISCP